MSKKWVTTILLSLLIVFPSSVLSQGVRRSDYVPGEVLVKFRSGVSRTAAQATHRSKGFRLIKQFRRIQVDHVKIPDGWTVEDAIATYRLNPDVEYAEPNYYRYASATYPNDPNFWRLWGLHNTGQTGGTFDADIDCPEAWDTETGGTDVVIAVLDTGVDYTHEDLAANIWTNPLELGGTAGVDDDNNGYIDDYYGWNFVNGDNDPDDDNDDVYHGTHVSGTIGAVGDNSIGVVGVSWWVSIMPLKILDAAGSGLVSDEIDAINYAIDNGAQIINASFSGGNSTLERLAIARAEAEGILFVAAAGNDGIDNDNPALAAYPASHTLPNIVAVAASDDDDDLASFLEWGSNWGLTSVDVAAPGVEIYSTKAGDRYQSLSGTSMATPHVSGLAALIWAQDDSLTYGQVKDRILHGVDTKSSLDGKVLTGGRINANNSILNLVAPPSDLTATAVSSSQIDLGWRDNAYGESGFKIERKEGSGGSYSEIDAVGANVESYSDTGRSQETTYYYQIRAFSADGDTAYSNEVFASTLAAPSGLSATAVSSSRIDLSWTDNSANEIGFKIERKAGSGGTYSQIDVVGADVTTYNSTGLQDSTTYYYRVRAYNGSGNSDYSNEAHATTSAVSASSGDGGGGVVDDAGSGGVPVDDGGGGGGGCFIGTAVMGSAHVCRSE